MANYHLKFTPTTLSKFPPTHPCNPHTTASFSYVHPYTEHDYTCHGSHSYRYEQAGFQSMLSYILPHAESYSSRGESRVL